MSRHSKPFATCLDAKEWEKAKLECSRETGKKHGYQDKTDWGTTTRGRAPRSQAADHPDISNQQGLLRVGSGTGEIKRASGARIR